MQFFQFAIRFQPPPFRRSEAIEKNLQAELKGTQEMMALNWKDIQALTQARSACSAVSLKRIVKLSSRVISVKFL